MEAAVKIGYKGFDKDLKCRGEQFEVGTIYSKDDNGERLKCCTPMGYHYCNKLNDVFGHYQRENGNRFCEIEVLGRFSDNYDKSITTSFRIIREITDEVYKKRINELMKLDDVMELQKKYPFIHVGGSVGLFLHGITTKRIKEGGVTDIDITTPFFTLIEGDDKNVVEEMEVEDGDYGDDFDAGYYFNGTKVEVNIDPKQRYEVIEYNGFKYKVTSLETIISYKTKYAMKGNRKHKDDLYEILGKKKNDEKNKDDLPW